MQPFTDFSGGLWIPGDANPTAPEGGFTPPANALLQADNVEYLPAGGIRGRAGRVRLNTAPYRATALLDPGTILGVKRVYGRGAVANQVNQPRVIAYTGNPAGTGPTWASVGTEAAVALAGGVSISNYVLFRGFNFDIEASALIVGIEVKFRQGGTFGVVFDQSVVLTKGFTNSGDRARTDQVWPYDRPLRSYGGSADLWGVNWSPAEINNPLFGFLVAVQSFAGSVPSLATIPGAVSLEPVVTVYYQAGTTSSTFYTLVSYNVQTPTIIERHVLLNDVGAFVTIPTTPTLRPVSRVRYVTWPTKFATYIFDGVNAPQVFSNPDDTNPAGTITALIPTENSVSPPLGPYVTLWNGRLWAAQPAEAQFSVYGCEVNDPTTWFGDVQLNVSDPDGGSITGIVGMLGAVAPLVILKDTALFYFLGDPLRGGQLSLYSRVGCDAPDTVALTPWGIVYQNRRGIYMTDGQNPNPIELSPPIAPLFLPRDAAITPYPDAVGIYHARTQQYHLKLDPTTDEGYVCHFFTNENGALRGWAWSRIPVMPLVVGSVWNGSKDVGDLIYGGRDGYIRSCDTGATDDDGGAGTPIPVTLRTVSRLLDDKSPLMREGRATYVKPQMRGTTGLTGEVRYDDDNARTVAFTTTAPFGLAVVSRRATITEMVHFGRVLDVQLANASDGPQFELYALGVDVALRSVRQWRNLG